jgi:phosphinothricin acetyltransferase
VATEGLRLLGYGSSQTYRAHPAFRHTVETSLYTAPGEQRRGVGSALYSALFATIAGQGLHRAVVGIALPNPASVALHERFGFERVGVFDEYAVKRGRRVSSVWMQKRLDAAAPAPGSAGSGG